MNNTIEYAGFTFTVYPKHGTAWNDNAGVYMFASMNINQKWDVYYIGQCDSFQQRIPTHERWSEAQKLGATHVLAVVVPIQKNRDTLEQGAIADIQPKLNVHHR